MLYITCITSYITFCLPSVAPQLAGGPASPRPVCPRPGLLHKETLRRRERVHVAVAALLQPTLRGAAHLGMPTQRSPGGEGGQGDCLARKSKVSHRT